jgi:hypothetical protein
VNKFINYILKGIKPVRATWNYAEKSGWLKGKGGKETPKPNDSKTHDRSRSKGSKEKSSPKTPVVEPKPDLRAECKGCGRRGHKREECRGRLRPDFNTAECSWEDSEAMKSIRENQLKDDKGVLLTTLPFNKRVDGTALKRVWDKQPAKRQKTIKSPCTTCHEHDLLTLARYGGERHRHTVSALLYQNADTMHVNILFDTGSLQSNYLSEIVANGCCSVE